MPELPDFKDPKFKFNDVDPRTDAMIESEGSTSRTASTNH